MSIVAPRSAVPQTTIVQVVAVPKPEGHGYTIRSFPERIVVDSNDAVLIFQLVEPTPDDVRFLPPTITPPGQDQFSTLAISRDGKRLIMSDLDSVAGIYHLLLRVQDSTGTIASHDPEVVNRPDTAA